MKVPIIRSWKAESLKAIILVLSAILLVTGGIYALALKPAVDNQQNVSQTKTAIQTKKQSSPDTSATTSTSNAKQDDAHSSASKESSAVQQAGVSPIMPAPRPLPIPTPSTPTTPFMATNVTVSIANTVCMVSYGAGQHYYGYNYSFDFNYPNSGGMFQAIWEYEFTDTPTGQGWPAMPILQPRTFPANTIKHYDTVHATNAFPGLTVAGYRARLKVIAPNVLYSNWIIIPRDTGSC